jgi:hypothetical protein
MPSYRLTWHNKAICAAVGAAASLAVLTGTASAASLPHVKPVGASLIKNGQFAEPGPAKNEGVAPTDWAVVDLGAETDPYMATIGVYNAKGQYPPPTGNPNTKDIADNTFYEAGTATGIEGIGGQQTDTTFGSMTQANNPQVGYSNVQSDAPEASVADWAGSGLEIDFTHANQTYSLIYLNPWTAYGTTPFSGAPVSTTTTKYILGPTLTADTWNTQAPRSLNADIDAQFKFKAYKVIDIDFINLEDTTSAAKPYPNMSGYFANLSVTEGASS